MLKNKSVLVTAPSGAGKTTLVKRLLAENPIFQFSVSCTTREKRDNETDGVDYYFLTVDEFKSRITENDFLEWEEVYSGSFYGTLKSEVEKIHANHNIPLFDIDIKGAMSIKKILCNDVLSIFIAAPSLDILEERLRARKTETEEKIKSRIDKAISEMKFQNFFDKKVLNDDLEAAYANFKSIIDRYLTS